MVEPLGVEIVSTHSRPKAAGFWHQVLFNLSSCFNTQPPEGGWPTLWVCCLMNWVSTHSRPKAAGKVLMWRDYTKEVSTHSRPKAAGAANAAKLL